MEFLIRSFLAFGFLFSAVFLKGQSLLADSIFHPDSLRHIVEVLASDSLKGRFTGTSENLKAALFIADEFKRAGIKPISGNNGFFMEIKPSWYNVVGAVQGKSKPGQVIIFSAHYDHVGIKNTNPVAFIIGNDYVEDEDTIFNGANDDASGVAAVISLAKYFKESGNNERTLIFVAFTGEELGLLGSQALADNCEPDSIIAVINIEMIGRGESKNSKPYVTGYEYSDLRKILNRNYQTYKNKKEREFFTIDLYQANMLFKRSDNYSFAVKGIPAHSIMLTSPEDKYYHNPNDETNTLNYNFMSSIIKAIATGTTGLVMGFDTPMRIKNLR